MNLLEVVVVVESERIRLWTPPWLIVVVLGIGLPHRRILRGLELGMGQQWERV